MSIFNYFEDIPTISPTHQWLIEALISDAPKDRSSLKKWVSAVDFEALEYASFRMIPALFTKYHDDPLCDPYRGRMKGIYRYFLFRASMLAADSRAAVKALSGAGIKTILFKGMAVALKYYGNPALRPMGDVDVLVHPEDVSRAEGVLQELGWKYRYSETKKKRDVHSHDYINANKNGFDLHWFALYESPVQGIDEGLWERAEHTKWEDIPVQVMGREDLILIAMINGRRGPESGRHEWIYDSVQIIRSSPHFDWALLWQEAGRRQLRHLIFDAMLLLNHLAPDTLELAHIHALVADAPDLCRRILRPMIAENRTHAIDQSQRARIDALLETPPSIPYVFKRLFSWRSAYHNHSLSTGTPKYIRYTTNEEGKLDSLYLHWVHLPILRNLFKVSDQKKLRRLTAKCPLRGEGRIAFEPGLLELPEVIPLPHHHAQIHLDENLGELEIPVDEVTEVALTVINDSNYFWYVRPDNPALYGVSYHLHSFDGELLQWDQPRTYFMQARPGYLAFVTPGQHLSCQMKIHAPKQPGHYRLQLDVLQETVLWFSGQNIRFPEIELNVIP